MPTPLGKFAPSPAAKMIFIIPWVSCRTTIASVNTVDTLYAALPAFLYLNPEIAGYLLSPLLEYQDSSAHTLSYAARNIGSFYPNATAEGTAVAHDYRIEGESALQIVPLFRSYE